MNRPPDTGTGYLQVFQRGYHDGVVDETAKRRTQLFIDDATNTAYIRTNQFDITDWWTPWTKLSGEVLEDTESHVYVDEETQLSVNF